MIQFALLRAVQGQPSLVPVTWIGIGPPPLWPIPNAAGLSCAAQRALLAAPTLIRRFVMSFLGSVTATPVEISSDCNSETVAVGALDLSTAKAPVTCGAAIDVPRLKPKTSSGTED